MASNSPRVANPRDTPEIQLSTSSSSSETQGQLVMVGHLFQNYDTIYVRFFPTYTCNHDNLAV